MTPDQNFLTLKGDKLINRAGQSVGLGGWMNMENFISGYPANEEAQRQTILVTLKPAQRTLQVLRPPMNPIRRCPNCTKCSIKANAPTRLVAITAGNSVVSGCGSTSHQRMPCRKCGGRGRHHNDAIRDAAVEQVDMLLLPHRPQTRCIAAPVYTIKSCPNS